MKTIAKVTLVNILNITNHLLGLLNLEDSTSETYFYYRNYFVFMILMTPFTTIGLMLLTGSSKYSFPFYWLANVMFALFLQLFFGNVVGKTNDSIKFYDGFKLFMHNRNSGQTILKKEISYVEVDYFESSALNAGRGRIDLIYFHSKSGKRVRIVQLKGEFESLIEQLKEEEINIKYK